jgi:hypothetical protein
MIGLLAQECLVLDQLVLLMKQSLFAGESLSQLDFRAPTPGQLTFAAFDCAMLLAAPLAPTFREEIGLLTT